MKKIVLLLIISLSAGGILFADMVFVVIAGLDEQLLKENQQVRDMVFSLESGAMDAFFEDGQIVSNYGISYVESSDALRLGKNSCADFLLVIRIGFVLENEVYSLERVSYSYLNVVSEKELYSGELDASGVYDEADLLKACMDFGVKLANACIYGQAETVSLHGTGF